MTTASVSLRAGCKINLYLHVGDRLPNGYHTLESLFLPLAEPHDILDIRLSPGTAQGLVRTSFVTACEREKPISGIDPRHNTLTRAAVWHAEQTGFRPALDILVRKGIPHGAGLGGGSADAAALLLHLQNLAGKKALIEYLKYTLPGFVFSVGLSPALAAATLASIRIIKKDGTLVRRLQENTACFVSEAKQRGFNLCLAGESAIAPILVGKESDAFALSAALLEKGIFVPPAVYPAVPVNKARLRFCLTSCHNREQITQALDVLKKLAVEMNIALPK